MKPLIKDELDGLPEFVAYTKLINKINELVEEVNRLKRDLESQIEPQMDFWDDV